MDTNLIKKFAVEARNKLKEGIRVRLTQLGFDARGQVVDGLQPQLMQGGCLWNGRLETEAFYHQWTSLFRRIQRKGLNEVCEEAAYTWFNRLMAIRILQKNGLCEPVLAYADAARTPQIVNEARMGHLPQMPEELRRRLVELLEDDTKVTEQFAVLLNAWCHQHPIIQNCFGSIRDYTELLLPNNILAEGGFIDMINHTEFISDEDYRSAELIGWLYQFYISERKDEVFAKKGKFEADEIPAATQIFTPNWIVKYMVQNTVGRIYLDNNPHAADELKPKWKYLVEPSEPTPEEAVYHYNELQDLKVADLACGSGHILNECFDLLYDLYIAEFYTRAEAIENIFTHNLTGIDLDHRAQQLSRFALLIKACQKDSGFADAHCMPRVLTMPEPKSEAELQNLPDSLHHFFQGQETKQMVEELQACFELMQNADSLGSIMKFELSGPTRLLLEQTVARYKESELHSSVFGNELPAFELILALTEKYSALIANPPYMGRGHMDGILSNYLDKNYPNTKADLFSTFMEMMLDKTAEKGRTAFITMESWMFLSSFEKFRKELLDKYYLSSLGHFGWHIIGIAFGTAMSVFQKYKSLARKGEYSYLTIDDIDRAINQPFIFPKKDNGRYSIISQNNFEKIPGCPIGYWVSEKIKSLFTYEKIADKGFSDGKNVTGDNERFLRYIWEVSNTSVGKGLKWMLLTKGGEARRWYGNTLHIIAWSPSDINFYHKNKISRVIKEYLWYRKGVTWSKICSGKATFRFLREDSTYDEVNVTPIKDNDLYGILAALNSKITNLLLDIINPTFSIQTENVLKLPYNNNIGITKISKHNIFISQQDWDAHETSWDFQRPEILSIDTETYTDNIQWTIDEHERLTGEHLCIEPAAPEFDSLAWCTKQYEQKWTRLFHQLHRNEEELNRQFIDIYGLQDELTPDVPLNEVTILQQGEISFSEDGKDFHFNRDVLMKQLISYAIGVWMGRYRLDRPGLHIAHPEPTAEELAPYPYKDGLFEIDDDGIQPILPAGCPFDDNLAARVADFVRIVFGTERLTENLNFMEEALGCSIEKYMLKDFWKDHKKMYQNRPIYWLFSSKKGAFRCLAYMHRMTPYTAERVRVKYLLPYIEFINQKVNELSARAASLSTAERRQMDNWKKTLDECNEYHDRLQVLAEDTERTAFDLDDGVVVNYAKYGDVLAKLK